MVVTFVRTVVSIKLSDLQLLRKLGPILVKPERPLVSMDVRD